MKKYLTILTVLLLGAFSLTSAQVNVTFKVDMSVQIAKGYFNPGTDVVTCPGGMNNWLNEPPANTEKVMTAAGDGIYEYTVATDPNQTVEFKFNIGLGWDGKDETTGNRSLVIGDADLTTEIYLFNNEEMPSGADAPVTFQVDMQGPAATGAFDPTQNGVYLAGSMTDWGTGALEMTAVKDEMLYEVTVNIASATLANFKFIWSPEHPSGDPPGLTWEDDPNRTHWVVDGPQTYKDWWNREDPTTETGDGNILFEVDASVLTEVGIFDPATDGMQVRGGFNGWSDGDPAVSSMNQDPFNANAFFLDIPFVAAPVGGEQNYKFFVDLPEKEWADPYERPFSQGGGNRDVLFEASETQEAGIAYYDDVHPDYVIEAGKVDVAMVFKVDMTNAADPGIVANPFDPANDTVYVVFEQPAFVFTQGWTDTDEMRVLPMTATGKDMVYEATLNVLAPAWNGFEYRYAFSSPVNGWIAEPAGFGDFAYRVRYMKQTGGARTFDQPHVAVTDTWIQAENKEAEWESGPEGLTSVGDDDNTILKFNLSQNYPNPFNPSTTIKFSIPESGLVSLKVYNVLGQQVATLLNQEISAGAHEYNFNAGHLSSGIYFYSIRTGDFVATKKMMLLK